MALLGFKKDFALAIETGRKTCTIRARRKRGNPWQGDTLFLYTGLRTPKARRIGLARCTSVRPIRIHSFDYVELAGEFLSEDDVIHLAHRDGFKTYADFYSFFSRHHGIPFEGLFIEWDQLRKG